MELYFDGNTGRNHQEVGQKVYNSIGCKIPVTGDSKSTTLNEEDLANLQPLGLVGPRK